MAQFLSIARGLNIIDYRINFNVKFLKFLIIRGHSLSQQTEI